MEDMAEKAAEGTEEFLRLHWRIFRPSDTANTRGQNTPPAGAGETLDE